MVRTLPQAAPENRDQFHSPRKKASMTSVDTDAFQPITCSSHLSTCTGKSYDSIIMYNCCFGLYEKRIAQYLLWTLQLLWMRHSFPSVTRHAFFCRRRPYMSSRLQLMAGQHKYNLITELQEHKVWEYVK